MSPNNDPETAGESENKWSPSSDISRRDILQTCVAGLTIAGSGQIASASNMCGQDGRVMLDIPAIENPPSNTSVVDQPVTDKNDQSFLVECLAEDTSCNTDKLGKTWFAANRFLDTEGDRTKIHLQRNQGNPSPGLVFGPTEDLPVGDSFYYVNCFLGGFVLDSMGALAVSEMRKTKSGYDHEQVVQVKHFELADPSKPVQLEWGWSPHPDAEKGVEQKKLNIWLYDDSGEEIVSLTDLTTPNTTSVSKWFLGITGGTSSEDKSLLYDDLRTCPGEISDIQPWSDHVENQIADVESQIPDGFVA